MKGQAGSSFDRAVSQTNSARQALMGFSKNIQHMGLQLANKHLTDFDQAHIASPAQFNRLTAFLKK